MGKCCEDTPNTLVVAAKSDKTCKVSTASSKIFNTYTLNKLQDIKKNNIIDFSNSKLTKALGKDAVITHSINYHNGYQFI